jgi:hypothetical protein
VSAPAIPDLSGFQEHYGVKVGRVGEYGDLVALGHHEIRRTIAAFNRHARCHSGWLAVSDTVKQTWAVLLGPCGDCDPGRPGCEQCVAAGNGDWWMRSNVDAIEPGAFPVTVLIP